MEFFSTLREIIELSDPYEKIAHFRDFYQRFQEGELLWDGEGDPVVFQDPSYLSYCRVVPPHQVPKRGGVGSLRGQISLLHSIAHIEYSAIDLALDGAYRFRGLPYQFYRDWLQVAEEECRHFLMIDRLLRERGSRYGALPVHRKLFDVGRATQTLLERMAVVPRYLEANGLDANPQIMERLKRVGDPSLAPVLEALELILREEIGHVRKGDRWFRWACRERGIEDIEGEYRRVVERFFPGGLKRRDINIWARKEAGFSCQEIRSLAQKPINC
ncbi:MAG: ferritin-like domain-containing protein [Epsilonproteobacteria bacterium]|nr:DUF455 domain-containing protein [Campylobacterota bacterium]NPA57093.1 ferritin-like domain-containing protein [Campylobacterota bacterium]